MLVYLYLQNFIKKETPRKISIHLQGIHSNTITAFLNERSEFKMKKFRHGEIDGGGG
jgi:hypothetical protein